MANTCSKLIMQNHLLRFSSFPAKLKNNLSFTVLTPLFLQNFLIFLENWKISFIKSRIQSVTYHFNEILFSKPIYFSIFYRFRFLYTSSNILSIRSQEVPSNDDSFNVSFRRFLITLRNWLPVFGNLYFSFNSCIIFARL